MSLFGGEGSAPPSESTYESKDEHLQLSSTLSSSSVDGHVSPLGAQHPVTFQYATDSGEDDDHLTDSESDSGVSDEELPTRLNRFRGAPAAWMAYTAADRQVAMSLEQIRDKDLTAHLYNAHALKRRVRRPAEDLAECKEWQTRDCWLKRGTELEHIDVSGETQTELVPPKNWTAWPLPPTKIPDFREQPTGFATGDSNEWRIGGASVQDAGEEIREELLATFLRLAKEQWNARETEEFPIGKQERNTQSRSRSRSRSVRSARSNSKADIHMKDDDDWQTDNAEAQDEDNQGLRHNVGKRRGRKPQPEELLKPAFLTDDERAMRILQPSINSILAKLDDLALAIRTTRLNHFGRGIDSDMSSHSEFTSGTESSEPLSRPSSSAQSRSRPRQSRKRNRRPVSLGTSDQYRFTTTKARIKAQNNHSNSSNDSASDSESSFDASTVKKVAVSRTPSRPRSTTGERTPSVGRDDTWRAGLMDWSEVLGLAAAKGWDERAISRTAQRCATLFGESMSLIPLDEGCVTKPAAEPVQYIPSSIPAPDVLLMKPSVPCKRPLFRVGTLRCPHIDCYGNENDFEAPFRVVQHCIRVHEYDPRTNDSDNEERMVGGVHIDGFLQPIAAQRGWHARGKSKAGSEKRKENEAAAHSHGVEDAMVIDSD